MKLRSYFFISIFLFFAFITMFIFSHSVFANVPYEASDVLGQTDKLGNVHFDTDWIGPASYDGFNMAFSTVVDSQAHRLFVSDSNNHRVLVFNLDNDNQPLDYIADNVLGQQNLFTRTRHCNNDSPPTGSAWGFCYPNSLTYDPITKYLYVSDVENNRILVFDLSSGITNGMDASYVLGQTDFTAFHAINSGTENEFGWRGVSALVIDSVGHRLFAASTNGSRVLVFNTSALQNHMNASYVLGQPDFNTTDIDTNAKGFQKATGLAYDSDTNYLYVSDSNYVFAGSGGEGSTDGNNRVLVFDVASISNNEDAIYVLGQTNFTSTGSDTNAKGFVVPQGIAVDSTHHRLFVTDIYNNRVLVFDTSSLSNNMDASYVIGQANFTSQDSGIQANRFYNQQLKSVSYDPASNRILVTDYSRVLGFDMNSISNGMDANLVIGQTDINGDPTFTTNNYDNELRPNARFVNYPYGAAIDTVHHRLFTSDRWDGRVLIFNLNESDEIVDRTADYVIGSPDLYTNSNCGVAPSATNICSAFGVAYDEVYERLFVADRYGNRVLVYDVTDGTVTNGMDAIYVLGQADFTSNVCNQGYSDPTAQSLCAPFGLAFDSLFQVLYVVDQSNSRVLAYDVSPSNISNNLVAYRVFGQADFISGQCNRGATLNANTLCNPRGATFNPNTGQLFIADSKNSVNNRVLIFDASPNDLDNGPNAVHVLGQPDFTTENTNTSINQINNPNGLAVDAETNKLYVNDEYNSRVLIYDIAEITDGEDAIMVLGQPDFVTSTTYATSNTSFYYATGVAVNASTHEMYIADSYENYRYLIFDFAHFISLTNPSPTIGGTISQVLGVGNQGTVTYSLSSGSLPPGVSLNAQTGLLSGTYSTPGTYSFTLSLTDDNGDVGMYTDEKNYSITVGGSVNSQSTTSSPRPEGEYSTTEAPVCNTPKPDSIPTLFQIERSYDHATIHFTPTKDNTTYYLLSYGTDSTAEGHSVTIQQPDDTSGAISYRIKSLNPKTSYYFKVRNGNSCNPGTFSQVRKDTNTVVTSTFVSSTRQTSDEAVTKPFYQSKSSQDNGNVSDSQKMIGNDAKAKTPSSASTQNIPWYQSLWRWFLDRFHL